jgi:hypothetical protein
MTAARRSPMNVHDAVGEASANILTMRTFFPSLCVFMKKIVQLADITNAEVLNLECV